MFERAGQIRDVFARRYPTECAEFQAAVSFSV